MRVVYRSSSGRLGFDSDDDSIELLEKMLQSAWAWNPNTNSKRVFGEEGQTSRDPYLFLASLGIPRVPTNIVTFHTPREELIKEFNNHPVTISQLSTEDKGLLYRKLIHYIPLCYEIMVLVSRPV